MHKLIQAAIEFKGRTNGTLKPEGYYGNGRWYASMREERQCCKDANELEADEKNKWSRWIITHFESPLQTHCCSSQHIANYFDVPEKLLTVALVIIETYSPGYLEQKGSEVCKALSLFYQIYPDADDEELWQYVAQLFYHADGTDCLCHTNTSQPLCSI